MSAGPVVGIDVGTSSATAAVVDPDRGVTGRGAASYPVEVPMPGRAEQDPRQWLEACETATRQAVGESGVAPADITVIAVSGQGACLVLLDERDDVLRPGLIHLDHRAVTELDQLDSSGVTAAVRQASGNSVGAWNVAAKLSWVRRHEPEVFAATRAVTSTTGAVLTWLTGERVQSESDAGVSDLFDRFARTWSEDVCRRLDLPSDLLPRVLPATAHVGHIRAEVAGALGLTPRATVVAGGEDTSSAALAAGALAPPDGFVSLGTAAVVGLAIPRGGTGDPLSRVLAFPHVRDDADLLAGSMTSAGGALMWWSGVTGVHVGDLLVEAERVPPGAGGVSFLPYLSGELHPVNDPSARGIFAGLSLASGRADLTRAIVEGSAGAIAHNLEVAMSGGAAATKLVATGKPSRSGMWMQAVADATGLPIEVVADDGAPLGNAILALAGCDAQIPDVVATHRSVSARYEPDPDQTERATALRRGAAALYRADAATRREMP